jgi:hypothetical protein
MCFGVRGPEPPEGGMLGSEGLLNSATKRSSSAIRFRNATVVSTLELARWESIRTAPFDQIRREATLVDTLDVLWCTVTFGDTGGWAWGNRFVVAIEDDVLDVLSIWYDRGCKRNTQEGTHIHTHLHLASHLTPHTPLHVP